MSAYLITVGFPHDPAAKPKVIAGPDVPADQQRAEFKLDYMAKRSHKTFRAVHLIDSRRGVAKRKNFVSPAEQKRREQMDSDADLIQEDPPEHP